MSKAKRPPLPSASLYEEALALMAAKAADRFIAAITDRASTIAATAVEAIERQRDQSLSAVCRSADQLRAKLTKSIEQVEKTSATLQLLATKLKAAQDAADAITKSDISVLIEKSSKIMSSLSETPSRLVNAVSELHKRVCSQAMEINSDMTHACRSIRTVCAEVRQLSQTRQPPAPTPR